MQRLLTTSLLAGFACAGVGIAQEATPEAAPEAPAETAPAEAAAPDAAASEAPAAADYDASTVLATVDGTEITLGHVIVMRDRLPPQYAELPDEVLLSGIVDQLVDQTILAGLASETPAEDPLEVQLHLENERRGTLASRFVNERIGQEVDQEAVQTAYDAAFGDFESQPEFNASHILVDSEEQANALKAEIDGGADFAEVAREHSSDSSATNGGELGWFGLGQMVPEFETAVQGMEPGEVAGPVQSQFGWHLIKLNEARQSAPPPLEQVRPQIEQQVRQEALEAELAELRAAAAIERSVTIPPAAIRETGLLQE